MESISTETWCSASGAMTDLAILVTPVAWQPAGARPLETTLSTSHVESATCMNSEGGSSARGKGREESCQGRISPRHGAGDAVLGVQTSPIHKWNELDMAQLLPALRWRLNLAAGMSGAKATTPPKPRMRLSSLCWRPTLGARECWGALYPKTSSTRALGLPGSSPAPQEPPAQHQGCSGGYGEMTRGSGGDEGRATLLSQGCQRLVPAWGPGQSPKKLLLWAGRDWGGRGLSSCAPHCTYHPTPERGWCCRGAPGLSLAPPSPPHSAPRKGQGRVGTQEVSKPLPPPSRGGTQHPHPHTSTQPSSGHLASQHS